MDRSAGAERSKVFISYSRVDVDFARQLVDALAVADIQAFLDLESIDAGEDWRERLGGLIRSSDSVVFILTEASAGSDICRWEVAEAVRLGKRCIPVLPAPFQGEAPEQLAALNYIFFHPHDGMPGSGFGAGLSRLVEALKTDLGWTREHTRLIEQAAAWIARGRREDQLLRGGALEDAEDWRGRAPGDVAIHESVLEFLAASSDAEALRKSTAKRQARRIFAGAAALLLLALAALGLAGQQGADAEALRSQQFADVAVELFEEGQHLEAIRAALLGDPAATGSIWSRAFFWRNDRGPARHALAATLTHYRLETITPPHEGRAQQVAFSADGARFATGGGSDGRVRLFERTADGPLLIDEFELPGTGIRSLALSPDGTRLAATSWVTEDSQVSIWRADDPAPSTEIANPGGDFFVAVAFSADGSQLIAARRQAIDIFELDTTTPRLTIGLDLPNAYEVNTLAASPDGVHIAIGLGSVAGGQISDPLRIHRLTDGAQIQAFSTRDPYALTFDSSGSVLAEVDLFGRVDIWEANEGRLLDWMEFQAFRAIALSPDASMLASGDQNGLIEVHELTSNGDFPPMAITLSDAASGMVFDLKFDQSGETVASVHQDGRARLWRLPDTAAPIASAVVNRATPPLFSPDGRHVFEQAPFGASNLLGRILDAQTGDVLVELPDSLSASGSHVDRATFSPDGDKLALFRRDKVEIWEVRAGVAAPSASLTLADTRPSALSFDTNGDALWLISDAAIRESVTTRDGRRTWVTAEEGVAHMWRFSDSTDFVQLNYSPNGHAASEVSTNGLVVGLRADGQGAQLYDLRAGQVVEPAISLRDRLEDLALTPDGTRIVTLDRSGVLEVWRVGAPRPEQRVQAGDPAYAFDTMDVAVSVDNEYFASLDSRTVKIWRFGEPIPLETIQLDAGRFSHAAFGQEGSNLIRLSGYGEIVTFQLDPILQSSPSNQLSSACSALQSAGASDFLDETVARHRILQRLQRDPCARVRVLPIPENLQPRPPGGTPARLSAE
ncbi:MAG: toll/interleukin-1 receptor domain-containing protein [Oceanicaulis sp.]